ncbi:MAG: hypothetical protein QW583_00945, partial [Sulfolobales archaeon]
AASIAFSKALYSKFLACMSRVLMLTRRENKNEKISKTLSLVKVFSFHICSYRLVLIETSISTLIYVEVLR